MKRGEVVLVEWVHSDLTVGKRRPAIVVQADSLNTVHIQVTKTVRNSATDVLIDPARMAPAFDPVGRPSPVFKLTYIPRDRRIQLST